MKIKPQPITPANFAKFGKVVTAPGGAPTSQASDYKFWSNIASYLIDGETEIGLCTVYKQPVTRIAGVERHMHSPEILIPIDAPFILPVLADGQQDDALEAFRVSLGEAVIIDRAVWHGACLPVGKKEATYFVIFRKNTPHEDVVKKSIHHVELEEPPA